MTKGDHVFATTKQGQVQIGVIRDFFYVKGKHFAVIEGEVIFIQELRLVRPHGQNIKGISIDGADKHT